MAIVAVQCGNPGAKIEVEVSDEMVMSLFTDAAAAKTGIYAIDQRIDQLWKVMLGFAVANMALLGAVLGAVVV